MAFFVYHDPEDPCLGSTWNENEHEVKFGIVIVLFIADFSALFIVVTTEPYRLGLRPYAYTTYAYIFKIEHDNLAPWLGQLLRPFFKRLGPRTPARTVCSNLLDDSFLKVLKDARIPTAFSAAGYLRLAW